MHSGVERSVGVFKSECKSERFHSLLKEQNKIKKYRNINILLILNLNMAIYIANTEIK